MESSTGSRSCSIGSRQQTDCQPDGVDESHAIVLSNEGKKIFEFVNFVTICGLVSLFGITANIINIIIFYKQGFTTTVNIAFLSLACSDLCCLTCLAWLSICMNPLLPVYDVTWISVEVMYLSAAWPHVCFCRITSYITVYITAERFISIAFPLKVKQIITAKRTTMIICLIYIVNMLTLVPEYSTSFLGWRFVKAKNLTLFGMVFTSSRSYVEGLCFGVHGLLTSTSFVGVVIFTLALVSQLRKTSEWRKAVTSNNQGQNVLKSNKERKAVKMIILIASLLIICYIPGAIISIVMFIVGPEFNITGKYLNICEALWSIAHCFQSINSSVNIFIYYKMSLKYRRTFHNVILKHFLFSRNSKTEHI